MIQAMYSGASGMIGNQYRLDVIGNNLANVNTDGFNSVRVDFKDALYQTMQRPLQPQDELNLELGHGVHVAATTRELRQGALLSSGRLYDLALEGNGYYAVRDAEGNTLYTRDGNFHLSEEEGVCYLVTHDGKYLLDQDGREIVLPEDPANFSVGVTGAVSQIVVDEVYALDTEAYEDNTGTPEPYAHIGIYKFPNAEGLTAVGGNYYQVSDNSGGPMVAAGTAVRQGYTLASTTDMGTEMTRLIRAQRAYQFSARVVTTADEMESMANNLRR